MRWTVLATRAVLVATWRMHRPATDGRLEAFTTAASGAPGSRVLPLVNSVSAG